MKLLKKYTFKLDGFRPTNIGLVAIIVISAAFVLFFYSKPLSNIGNTFFAADGDGLKDYYNSIYYIKYDDGCFHSGAMNYPYGENIFYTGNQPTISLALKFINNNFFELSPTTIIAVFNLAMLFSLVLGAIFLYLLLVHFKLPAWYSVLVALGLTFLSPQLARMPGHFSLSYVFVIPAIFYLVAKFHDKHNYWISLIIGIFVVWAFGTHAYMLAFLLATIGIYWLFLIIFHRESLKLKSGLINFSLQIVFPLFVIALVSVLTDQIDDRTSYPIGFLYYKGTPEGVFLPIEKPYGRFLSKIINLNYFQWESISYIGLVGVIGFLMTFGLFVVLFFKRKYSSIISPSGNPILDLFFWFSILMLIFSFGIPFIIGELKYLINYIGPIKQFRAIARFSWMFFYIINIFVFYKIFMLKKTIISRYLFVLILIVSLSFLYYDSYTNVRLWSSFVNNKIPRLSDWDNKLEENSWVDLVDASKYQAVIPLPYFHVGSEVIWRSTHCGIARHSYLVSLKTGIPNMGVMLSRTSISQTFETFMFFQEPYRYPKIISSFNQELPFLLVVSKNCDRISENHQILISKSVLLASELDFLLYELPFDSIKSAFRNPFQEVKLEIKNPNIFSHGELLSTSEVTDFMFTSFVNNNEISYFNGGAFERKLNKREWIEVDDFQAIETDSEYIFSFWVDKIDRDVFLRSRLLILQTDSIGEGYYETDFNLGENLVLIDGKWGLIERTIKFRSKGDKLKWRLYSNEKKRTPYTFSSFLLRPIGTNVYKKNEDWIMRNNRYYLPD